MSQFESLQLLPEDPILSIPLAFAADLHPKKVNLGIGVYRDAEGKPLVLVPVTKAESIVIGQHLNKEYQSIDGNPDLLTETAKLIFGPDSKKIKEGEYYGVQTIGGTCALRIGADLLVAQGSNKPVYIPDPTWANHRMIFTRAGLKVENYPYYNAQKHSFDFEGVCDAIKAMPAGSTIVLHASCHNPTGLDPTLDQWKTISELLKKHSIFPFFDVAYQGFGEGLNEDVKSVRLFADQGHEFFVSYSFSKNMGLYGERIGAFFAILQSKVVAKKLGSHARQIIRAIYSTPPLFISRVVATVLAKPDLHKEWEHELESMRERIQDMRKGFVAGLLAKSKDTKTHFSVMDQQKGLFSYCKLAPEQIERLRTEFGIYVPGGRINIAGLNWNNMDYVIDSFIAVTK